MTNYNERLDKALERLAVAGRGWGVSESVQIESMSSELDEAKQAITSLIKELVADAKPSYKTDTRGATQNPNNAFYHTKKAQGYNEAIEDYEQNLLKALEEVE